jgi:four helix bundle protein
MTDAEKVKIKSFTDLNAWREGHNLVLLIYKITREFPKDEVYCLVSQMRRAAISITSNIAEGFGRHGYKEKIQFYYLAQGSLLELKNQILVAKDVGYIKKEDLEQIVKQANDAHRLLQGLITSSKAFLNHKS